jgi:hypothetical protein
VSSIGESANIDYEFSDLMKLRQLNRTAVGSTMASMPFRLLRQSPVFQQRHGMDLPDHVRQ